jgi:inner membrane protein
VADKLADLFPSLFTVVIPMTAQGHLLFSVTCVLVAHQLKVTPALADVTLWLTVPAALASALLPDLDHPHSLLGRRLRLISIPLSRIFGHRGFTHSLLMVALAVWGLEQGQSATQLPTGVKDALIIGYLSHLLADWLTPAGIPLFWPLKRRYRLPLLQLKAGGAIEAGFCTLTLLAAVGWVVYASELVRSFAL